MSTIKAFTDIEQSKRLAKILPIESADMYYPWYIEEDRDNIKSGHRISIPSVGNFIHKVNILPCWSLAALIDLCPTINGKQPILTRGKLTSLWYCYYEDEIDTQTYDNPIDACYEMIIRLNELNLL